MAGLLPICRYLLLVVLVACSDASYGGGADERPDAAAGGLLVSTSQYRAEPRPLDGRTVSGSVYILFAERPGIEKLEFYLDDPERAGEPMKVDTSAPFDLMHTASPETARPLATGSLPNGEHSVTAVATLTDGRTLIETATFTVANVAQKDIYWAHDFENGSVEPFKVWKNGNSSVDVTDRVARSGEYAGDMTISNPGGRRTPGSRLAVPILEDGSPLPRDAFYSSWFFIPQHIETPYNIIFQWKNRDPEVGSSVITYGVSIRNRDSTGAMYLAITRHIGDDGTKHGDGWGLAAEAAIDLPAGQWFHLECRYVWSSDDGRVKCWQDGRELWDLRGVPTEYAFEPSENNWTYQWTLANYASETLPETQSIYVDDAMISAERVGPAVLGVGAMPSRRR